MGSALGSLRHPKDPLSRYLQRSSRAAGGGHQSQKAAFHPFNAHGGRHGDLHMITREYILSEMKEDLDELLVEAPEHLLESTKRKIKDDAVAYTQRVLDALSTEELQSETAYVRFLQTTLEEARMRMHGVRG